MQVETLDRKLDLVLKLLKDERRSASMMSSARSASFSNTLAPERYSSPERKRGDVYDEKPPLPRSNTEKEHRKKSRFKVTIIDADRGSDSDPTIHI